jgi:hypothetical protein
MDGSRVPRPRHRRWQHRLAARYAPVIYFDNQEPFLPLAVGYTVFTADADSPSFSRRIELTGAERPAARAAIEYAIWWDWDIQHLYELEHTWSYVGADGSVVFAEASWHGGYAAMLRDDGSVRTVEERGGIHPVVYSEPGKHAFAPAPEVLIGKQKDRTLGGCGPNAGSAGLLVTPLFQGILELRKSPRADALVAAHLKRHAFVPDFAWTKRFPVTGELLVPWPALFEWIPARVDWWLARLEEAAG